MAQEPNLNMPHVQPVTSASEDPQPEKITLWGEIGKGWHWVVFIWKMMSSFGGISSLLTSIKRTIIMLIKRLLIQLQTSK